MEGVRGRAPRHDRDAGGPPEQLAAKAALRQEAWESLTAARVARFPGAAGRIPNFVGAERLRRQPEWRRARTPKANPDSARLPVRQAALEDGETASRPAPPWGRIELVPRSPRIGRCSSTASWRGTGPPAGG
jgi:5-formyltetrahydrofolate cyclo-ligase